ncbi:MAG: MATE family efflux transporter [bacterium]
MSATSGSRRGGVSAGGAGVNLLTQGSIRRSILVLALPAMGSMIAQTLFGLVDGFWVGRLGPDSLAAFGGASFFYWALLAISETASVGTAAYVSQLAGAGDRRGAAAAGSMGLASAFLLGCAVVPIGLAAVAPVVGLMRLPPLVAAQALEFARAIIVGLPFIYAFYTADAVYRGFGNTRTPMFVDFGAVLLNAILTPALIYGWGPCPALGIGGAGYATVLAHALGLAVKLARARANGIDLAFPWGPPGARRSADAPASHDTPSPWRIGRVGLPVAFTGLWICGVFVMLTRLLTNYGTAPLAALSIGHRLESVPYFACVGFSGAAAALVGQNLGAGQPDRASRAAWGTVAYCAALILSVCFVYFFFATQLVGLFTTDPGVIDAGARYLRIVALVEVFMGIEIVLIGALSGAGDTAMPMLITSLFAAARVPAGAILAGPLGFGVDGIWMAICGSVVIRGVLMAAWFRTGRWKKRGLTRRGVSAAPEIVAGAP